MKLYKYRGMSEFQRDLNTIVNNKLYASSIIKLNDPFELLLNYEESYRQQIDIMINSYDDSKKEILRKMLDTDTQNQVLSLPDINERKKMHNMQKNNCIN